MCKITVIYTTALHLHVPLYILATRHVLYSNKYFYLFMYRVYKVMKFKISINLYCIYSSYILVKLLKFIFMTTITLESENEKKEKKHLSRFGLLFKVFFVMPCR